MRKLSLIIAILVSITVLNPVYAGDAPDKSRTFSKIIEDIRTELLRIKELRSSKKPISNLSLELENRWQQILDEKAVSGNRLGALELSAQRLENIQKNFSNGQSKLNEFLALIEAIDKSSDTQKVENAVRPWLFEGASTTPDRKKIES